MSTTPSSLERWYRLLLTAYPRPYRREHGSELMGTLLATAAPRQRLPSLREAWALIAGGAGVRVRVAPGSSTPWWVDGLHLGVFLLVLAQFVWSPMMSGGLIWMALCALTVVATLLRFIWVALPLASVAAAQASRPLLYDALPAEANRLPFIGPAYGDWGPVVPYLLAVVGLAVLARWRPRDLRRRSWWWLPVPVAFVTSYEFGLIAPRAPGWLPLAIAAAEVSLLLVAVLAAHTNGDARWALAALCYLVLPRVISFYEGSGSPEATAVGYLAAATAMTAVVALVGERTRVGRLTTLRDKSSP